MTFIMFFLPKVRILAVWQFSVKFWIINKQIKYNRQLISMFLRKGPICLTMIRFWA